MAVRFVIGRAGTGKTSRCFRGIADALRQDPAGPPIFWILPKQATFTAERQLTCASGLGGYCRAHVLSFDTLAESILAECGGAAVPEVTPLGRQMVLGHLLRKHEPGLTFFDKVARHPGLAAKLESTLDEFDRCGREPAELETALKDLFDADGPTIEADPLRAKLHDLALIYKAWCEYLGQDRLDPRRRMEQVLACIDSSRQFRGSTIYVDGFAEFTEFERRVLARLGKTCRSMEIMLLMDPASPVLRGAGALPQEMSLFHKVEQTYRRLMKTLADEHVDVEPPLLLREPKRFASPALAAIERNAFSDSPAAADAPPDGIELVEAQSRRSEVEHAARRIRDLLRSGLRLRDIAVLVRSLDTYHDLINAVFHEHAIRYFVDRRRSMAHHPLLQFVRAVLLIALNHWPHDAVMMLLKCGLGGLSPDEADRLENYVLEHRLRGAVWARAEPWQWCRRMTRPSDDDTATEPDESAAVDALRQRVYQPLAPFVEKYRKAKVELPLKEIATDLFHLFARFNVRPTLATWINEAIAKQLHEQANEHHQAWEELVALFEQMVDLLGPEPMTLADFHDVLEAGLETFDLALTPPTVDEVLVGQVDRTRTPDVKAVLVLGLNEGLFPHSPRDASILSDAERIELERRQFDIDPHTERRLLDEHLLGYIALTRASQLLYLSRSTSDDAGRPLGPSPYWRQIRRLFPTLRPTILPRDDRTDPSLIGTPRQLLTALMRWARSGGATSDTTTDDAVWPALYQWLATYPTNDDPLDTLRHRAWKALSYDNSAALSPHLARLLFPTPLRATVTQIETFAACPFKHFLRHGLKLESRDEDDVLSIDLDNAFHEILEHLVRDMLHQRADWSTIHPDQARQLVQTYAGEVAATLRGELMLSSARNRYLLSRIERTLDQVLAFQHAAAGRSAFKTNHARVKFGSDGADLPPLVVPTPTGSAVHVHGRIDRIDVLEEEAAFAVFDYQLYGNELSLTRAYHGLSLQLLTYLLVVRANADKLAGRALAPAAGFYVRLLRQLEKVDHPADACEPDDLKFPLRGKMRGIFDARFFPSIDNDPDCTSSDVVAARLKKDGTFGYKGSTDVAEPDEFAALLNRVHRHIADLGDRIMRGSIDLQPFRMGTTTPCPRCSYRSVCRFDANLNHYHHIPHLKREDVLKRVVEEAADGQ